MITIYLLLQLLANSFNQGSRASHNAGHGRIAQIRSVRLFYEIVYLLSLGLAFNVCSQGEIHFPAKIRAREGIDELEGLRGDTALQAYPDPRTVTSDKCHLGLIIYERERNCT